MALCFVASYLSIVGPMLLAPSGGFRAVLSWLPAGVSAAMLLRWGPARWPWIAAGLVAGGLTVGQPTIGMVASVPSTVLGPWLLAVFLESRGFQRDFRQRRDVVLFAAATPVAMLVTPTLLFAGMRAMGMREAFDDPVDAWLRSWLNATISVVAVAPAFIAASRDTLVWLRRQRIEAMLLAAATAAFAVGALSLPGTARASWIGPIGILVVLVSALRMPVSFTSVLALAMTASVAIGIMRSGNDANPARTAAMTATVWGFCMVLSAVTLMIRALLTEREAADRRLREAEIRYRKGLLDAAHHEQERLGREMHDALGQELTGLSLMVRGLEASAGKSAPDLVEPVNEISQACRRAIESTRAIARGLLLPTDQNGDLGAALRALAASVPAAAGVQVRVDAQDGLAIDSRTANSLYRIAQEALNNALKHSRARRIDIRLARSGDILTVRIEDDGQGMTLSPDPAGRGLGMRTMQYRAEVAGGQLRVDSLPGQGTRVICTIDLAAAADPGAGAASRP